MATFTNQATLTYNNNTVNSNIVTGEIVEVITANKTAVKDTYNGQDVITYVVNILNSGDTVFNGLTVSDNLGEYPFSAGDIVPETYVEDSVKLFVDGEVQPQPTVTGTNPLVISGISVPANNAATLVYSVRPNQFTPLEEGATITNVATVSGAGLTQDVLAEATIDVENDPQLSITKSVNPTSVVENGPITYSFLIENTGNAEADAADNVTVTDTFNPAIDITSVTLDGVPLDENTGYTYDPATGVFSTVPGQITVPAASFAQDIATGAYITNPGTRTLVVSGTV